MKYYVYVIKSDLKDYHYVGFTINLKKRLDQHNKIQVRSTKAYVPFSHIYDRIIYSRKEARDYEK
ncbi:MAG: GIY-YIG nuclease family protein [Patescibacteria group bacterium]|nr:GIY-YIG nuclease family protein [Patescibacteria group bacterium]